MPYSYAEIDRVAENSEGLSDQLCRYVMDYLSLHKRVNADDLRGICQEMRIVPHHPNVIGAVFNILRRRNLIKPDGYSQSLALSRRGGAIRNWVLA